MKITKSQLRQIIKEEISREIHTENALSNMINRLSKQGADIPREKTVARMAYQLTYRDDGGESGVVDIYADSDDEAVEKAVERVKMMGNKYNQKFVVSRLVSPDGEIVAS